VNEICPVCNVEFTQNRSHQRYCSVGCRDLHGGVERMAPNVVASDIGAINELRASAWLMSLGWKVFRNLSPCGPVDIVAIKDESLLMIDVKTKVSDSMSVRWPKEKPNISLLESNNGSFDWKYKTIMPVGAGASEYE